MLRLVPTYKIRPYLESVSDFQPRDTNFIKSGPVVAEIWRIKGQGWGRPNLGRS